MSTVIVDKDKGVYFAPEQIKWLESMFPERVLPCTTSEAEVREYFGTRKVLACIKERKRP